MGGALWEYGVDGLLLRAVGSLYCRSLSFVRNASSKSDPFLVGIGLASPQLSPKCPESWVDEGTFETFLLPKDSESCAGSLTCVEQMDSGKHIQKGVTLQQGPTRATAETTATSHEVGGRTQSSKRVVSNYENTLKKQSWCLMKHDLNSNL